MWSVYSSLNFRPFHFYNLFYTPIAVPAPKHLTLERQLNKSILISWTPPDGSYHHGQVEMYHVYVDGFLRTTVKSTDKTKALVEGVDSAKVREKKIDKMGGMLKVLQVNSPIKNISD